MLSTIGKIIALPLTRNTNKAGEKQISRDVLKVVFPVSVANNKKGKKIDIRACFCIEKRLLDCQYRVNIHNYALSIRG